MPHGPSVRLMFGHIAARYDLANHILSGGLDFLWRRTLVSHVRDLKPRHVVDLATGSGDVAFAIKRVLGAATRVEGYDFCAEMLALAEQKKRRRSWARDIHFIEADCLRLPLVDESVETATIAFGLRNLEDRHRGLVEIKRILNPSRGHLLVLEFSQPSGILRPIYFAYLRWVLPHLAGLLTGRSEAYRYLVGSIAQFPTREELEKEILQAGFQKVRTRPLTGSTVALHVAN